jgi:xanthine dehydrogenase large subunit
VLKRGLALTPVKFGISFNVVHFNQAGALVHIYTDGSVLVNHGGTEMGQGLNTKVARWWRTSWASRWRAGALHRHRHQKVANTSATAASTGSDLNGKAAQDAARQMRERLARLPPRRGAATRRRALRQRPCSWNMSCPSPSWCGLPARVQLWSDGFYATPGLSWDRETLQGKPFYYFAYGAAVSEVIVDTLTGEQAAARRPAARRRPAR